MTTLDHTKATRDAILAQTPPQVRSAIARISAANLPRATYIVAGVVRDALLGHAFRDVDLATEGDAIDAVRAAFPGARITSHEAFRTASVSVDDTTIDVVTARKETYATSGALPDVTPASIDDDLRRRDFTINSLAVRLDTDAPILDPTDGLGDLQRGLIRAHHDRSFEDDPTRIYRALRYAARLSFAIEPHTDTHLRASMDFVQNVSGARVRHEVELMLLEANADGLGAAHAIGALAALHPGLSWDERRSRSLASESFATIPRLPFGFALLSSRASMEEAAGIIDRLRLGRQEASAVTGMTAMRDVVRTLRRPGAKPSGVVVLLDRYPLATVAAFAATSDDPIAAQLALRYLGEWRNERPLLHGDDLVALGVPEGPQIQKGLQLIRAARLDGWASDEGDERALALRFAKSIRDSRAANADIELQPNGH